MTTNLLELAADIVIAHASTTELTPDQLLNEIKMVFETLKGLDQGKETPASAVAPAPGPKKRGRKPQTPAQPKIEKVAEKPSQKAAEQPTLPLPPVITLEEAFKPDQVSCMICGKTGMKTLKRHLSTAHGMKPGKYKKQFNIPKDQPLAALEYAAKRRQMALDRGLGDKLAAARKARKKKE